MDHSRLAVAAAVPGAIGYAVPLVAGLATGHVADGVAASAGALIVGFANLGGRYQVRAATLLAATAAAGMAALAGGLAGPSVAATVVLMGGWGFATGLLVAIGSRAAFVGLLSTWALLLAGDLNLHGGEAALHEAWLITAGALAQTAVALAAWPLRPFATERRAVADAYRALARYARAPDIPTLQSAAAALATAADAIGPGTTFPGERGTLRWLLEQGEWIRLELAAVARSPAPGVDATLGATANVLDAIAEARDPARLLSDLRSHAQAIDETAARRRAAALAACVTAAAGESGTALPSPAPHTRPLRSLREQLTLDSRAFRHAVRLSVSLIAAGIAYRGLSLGVGYWVPLTVLFVLRPDYGTTITRGIGRAAGTAAGVTIAWVIVTALSPGSAAIVALLALLAFAAYALFPANYALYSVVLPVLIALLVEFSGGSPVGALLDRILDTALGTAIALGTYLAWPTREAPHMLESLALYVTAEGRWLDAILNAYAGHDGPSMRSMRLDARRARTNAWDAVRRALAEPPRRRPDDQPLGTTLATMDEISDSALVLAAAVHDGIRAPRDALAPYRRALAASFADLARVFRADARPTTKPPRDAGLTAVTTDPGLEAVTTETAIVLTKLNWLEQTWQESTRPPNQHRSFDRGRDVD